MSRLNRRHFIATTVAAGVTTSLAPRSLRAANANSEVNIGFISCGSRAGQLMGQFDKIEGVNIVGLCDVDENRVAAAKKRYPKADTYTDLRELIANDNLDAIVVATCNHWHCLAAIWAMEAGKDVYVEKPLSHSQWEGRQTVAAARKYNRICQLGTQQRSDPMQAEIKKFLHEEKALGKIEAARVNRYGIRGPIGKRDTPLEIEKNVAYDLWLGPAEDQPLFRNQLHYDWHWDWNTGSGEMGNWGVHVLDDCRNNVFQDSVALPSRIMGGGGRIAYNDAGQTPNVHFTYFDTGDIPVVIGLSNLPSAPGGKKSPGHPGPGSGYVAYCEGGRFEGQRGRGAAYDSDGKKIRDFKGNNGDVLHQRNFIEAVRAQDRSILNAEVEVGNDSTGWCNLANIAFRAGTNQDAVEVGAVDLPQWDTLIGEMTEHLSAYDMDFSNDQIRVSPMLTLDEKTEQFTGDNAQAANELLRRQYREGFEVPELV
ncbi:4-carboxy-2-hydroxymuconate-6-semialdehyde dehydrogenase [Rubripirellula lacrimiformis]|uniref:4-carboxy-2-hydroxymuconate-6-semialdehyde dehydrogenase n=1 Tax=Rubripirellula lacrimiformis TaxID=1930273 RepID=A0A517NK60_9BACT|nr:Gfo/Idh/MocA family oxidoreductase [Rubripirellula lacrimiformis]QDT07528.1 4-carboxy-2-hydroxymuconate-6-semialdehyde dehydrogenase [Rubripirellula lacrimiformis]